MENLVIGIEGYVGAGKTAICKELLNQIPNSILLQGGNLYRGIAYALLRSGANIEELKQNMKQNFTENGEVKIIDNESSVVAFSMVNNIVSGVEYPQKVTINANNLKKDSRIRAKANVISSDGDIHNVKLVVDANWIIGDDGYYYYKNLVVPADNFELCGRVELPIGFSIENQNENKPKLK